MFLAIVEWTADNRVAKYQDFRTRAEANAHISDVEKGFVVSHPGGGFADWLVDPVAETLTIEPDLDALRTRAAQNIKDEAKFRILTEYPDWKQRNMTALGVSLVRKMANGTTLTADEQTAVTRLDAIWSWISSVRETSDTLEANVQTMTADQLRNFIPTDDSHWPSTVAPVTPRRN